MSKSWRFMFWKYLFFVQKTKSNKGKIWTACCLMLLTFASFFVLFFYYYLAVVGTICSWQLLLRSAKQHVRVQHAFLSECCLEGQICHCSPHVLCCSERLKYLYVLLFQSHRFFFLFCCLSKFLYYHMVNKNIKRLNYMLTTASAAHQQLLA